MIPVTFRPIDVWPADAPGGRAPSQFKAGWSATMELLDRELRHLGARNVAIQLALAESDIRLDGWPRATARPEHPGVIVSFESRYGPLRYATARFSGWQDNLRAIALGLEALRKVDRYGVTKRGQQYTGWKVLPAGGASVDRGRDLIRQHGGVRQALMATHPDHGGDAEEFADVQAAREAAVA